MPSRRAIREIVTKMIALVPADALEDLRSEDPATAAEVHFEPLRVHRLPSAQITDGDCSVDGYYEQFVDPQRPRILYSGDVVAERARFTVIHELGHHIVNSVDPSLLDDLDRLGNSPEEASQAEEMVCHQFAGEILVPVSLLDEVIADEALLPNHIVSLRDRTNASWEAIAVQAANHAQTRTVVALVRKRGEVSFVAANWPTNWRRNGRVKPNGPLDMAFFHDATARPDVYRHELGGAEALFCDTQKVDEGLAVAVMSPKRSDGRQSSLESVVPTWKEREEYCSWCGEERNVDWCDFCSGQKCWSCNQCGCQTPATNPICPECFLHKPFRSGACICRDCEAVA